MHTFKKFAPACIIIAALLWSLDGLLRRSLYTLPPAIVVFWEHLLGMLVLFPFTLPKFKELRLMTRKEWIAIALVSLFSGALGTIFYTAALGKVNYIQFSVVVLLQQLQPIWAIIMAAILLRETITRKFLAWASVAIIASYLVTFKDLKINISPGDQTILAAGLAISAGVMWAISTSFSKIVLNKISYVMATFLRFLFAPLFAFIFIIAFNQTSMIFHIDTFQWKSLGVIVFSTGMVALLIYYYGLTRTPAKHSAIYELIWPVSAIFIDYFYFHRGLSLTQMIGACLVLFAIYKITRLSNQTTNKYHGVVLKGTQDGRKIGFPTVNLDPHILPPNFKHGVYATVVYYEGKKYLGALFYGSRLVKKETHHVLEIHILQFEQSIYGKTIEFEVKNYIREVESFSALKELQKQIKKDIVMIKDQTSF